MPSVPEPINYPDVLGYITGGARVSFKPVQVAIALEPAVTRAGKPIAVYLLLQNASDADLDVVVTLRLPDRDAKGQKERFITRADRLNLKLEAAQVGAVLLPMSTLPDTAVSDGYRIGMDVKVTPVDKRSVNHVRLDDGGGVFDPNDINPEMAVRIEELRRLQWSVDTPRFSRTAIETGFTILSGKVGAITDLSPRWESLWSLGDARDDRLLIDHYGRLLEYQILPTLKPDRVYPATLKVLAERFRNMAYRPAPIEVTLIAQLITLLLELAHTTSKDSLTELGEVWSVRRFLKQNDKIQYVGPLSLPRWCRTLLLAYKRDQRVAQHPVQAVLHFAYDDLLRDAMILGMQRIAETTDLDIGGREEWEPYCDELMQRIHENRLDFASLYMPLVMGGLIAVDHLPMAPETLGQIAGDIQTALRRRQTERNEVNDPIFEVAEHLVNTALVRARSMGW